LDSRLRSPADSCEVALLVVGIGIVSAGGAALELKLAVLYAAVVVVVFAVVFAPLNGTKAGAFLSRGRTPSLIATASERASMCD